MKIFVTGSNGFIGKNFIEYASSQGHFIYAVSRKGFKIANQNNIRYLKGNFYDGWFNELKSSDILVHFACAGVVKKASLKNSIDINVNKSFLLLQNAAKAGCLNWLIISSSSEYGELLTKGKKISSNQIPLPKDNYGLSKMIFTYLSMHYTKIVNANCTVLRLFQVYGKGENKKRLWSSIKKAAINNQIIKINNPLERRDFSDIETVKKKILDICCFKIKNKKKFKIWHLANGTQMTILDFAKKTYYSFNKKIKVTANKPLVKNYHHITDKKSIWDLTK